MRKGLKIAFISAITSACLLMGIMCMRPSKQALVRAEEPETTESIAIEEESEPIVEEESEPIVIEEESEKGKVEEAKEWIKQQYETLVVPLVTGLSLSTIVSIVFSVVFTVAKNKALNEKYKKNDEEAKAKLLLIEEATEKLLIDTYEKMNQISKALEDVEAIKDIDSAVRKDIDCMVAKIQENNEIVKRYEKIEPILQILVQLEIKIAKANKNNVANGLVEDINKLANLIKDF